MSKRSDLSGEEISALMGEVRESGTRGRKTGVTRPFSFGSEAARPMAALPALDRMNERMARPLRALIEPLARARPRVTAEPMRTSSFADWQAEQGEFTSLSIYGFRPLKGAILLSIEPDFVRRLVDAFYGGSGGPVGPRPHEFTGTEESLLARLADGIAAVLADAWAEIAPVKPQLRARETNAGFAGLAKPDETVAVARFNLAPWDGPTAAIEIVYPVATLRGVEDELAAQCGDEAGTRGSEWRERLAAAVGGVCVEARTVLARPELTLSELMRLRPGDVIPVSLPSHVPLLVEGRRIAIGTVGEQDGRAALMIERIETRRLSR